MEEYESMVKDKIIERYAGWAKKNAQKTETFLLFGKIVKKLIITGISIISSIITQ